MVSSVNEIQLGIIEITVSFWMWFEIWSYTYLVVQERRLFFTKVQSHKKHYWIDTKRGSQRCLSWAIFGAPNWRKPPILYSKGEERIDLIYVLKGSVKQVKQRFLMWGFLIQTLFIFTTFVSMSRPRSIYIVSMLSFFHFHLHFHYD